MADFVSASQNSVILWDGRSFQLKSSTHPFGETDCHIAALSWSSRTRHAKLCAIPKWGDRLALADGPSAEWSYLSHEAKVDFTCGTLMNNSHYLLTGCSDASLLIWDIRKSRIAKQFKGHTSPLTCAVRSASDQVLVSGSQDGAVLMHTVASQQTVVLTKGEGPRENGDLTPINHGRHAVKNLRKCQHLYMPLITHPDHNTYVLLEKEKGQLGSVGAEGSVCLWSIESQRLLSHFAQAHGAAATDLCFSPSNNLLMVSVGMDAKLHCWDTQQRKPVTVISAPAPLTSVLMLRDGNTLVAGAINGLLYVYELRSVKSVARELEGHGAAVTCITQQTKSGSHRSSRSSGSKSSTPQLSPAKAAHLSMDSYTGSTSQQQTPIVQPPAVTMATTASGGAPDHRPSWDLSLTTLPGASLQTPHPSSRPGVAFATPTNTVSGETSGIFSPIDANLTKSGAVTKATAAVHPTQRGEAGLAERPPGSVGRPVHPLHSTALEQTAGSSPALDLPAGIFSPLYNSPLENPVSARARKQLPSPLLAAMLPPSPANIQAGVNAPSPFSQALPSREDTTPLTKKSDAAMPERGGGGPGQGIELAMPMPLSGLAATQLSGGVPTPLIASARKTQPLAAPPSPPQPSPSLPQAAAAAAAAAVVAMPPGSASLLGTGLQLPYIESLIKDSSEELRYAVHRDIRALSLDMFKQFFVQQQQLAASLGVLSEKIDRLSDENQRLKELLQQYAPIH